MYLKTTVKKNNFKEARDKKIFELWMACYTQEEIAGIIGCHQTVVGDVLREMADLPESLKPAASHLTDFDIPLYNVWKFKEKTPGAKHFGNKV
ncbi:MAG: hypothetical protein AB1480_05810 [Nitrospirota bacterium]